MPFKKLYSSIYSLMLALLISACQSEKKAPETGDWTGYFELMDGEKMPVRFAVVQEAQAWRMDFYNVEETLSSLTVQNSEDSLQVNLPFFEAFFMLKTKGDSLWGKYYIPDLGRELNFSARPGKWIAAGESPITDLSGRWETEFKKTDQSTYPALTLLEQKENHLSGTVRTTTGDYRYLEGEMVGSRFSLSTFDGAHQYLLKGRVENEILTGEFYLGNHEVRTFTASRNEEFVLASADSLSYLLPGYDRVAFRFRDLEGKEHSLDDAQFKNKPVVIQLMGSWCPNCLEESKFIKEYRETHPGSEVAYVALAFEYAKTEERAFEVLKRHRDRLGIDYPILLAQYGGVDKDKAREKLPMLSSVWSYPTLIFLDQNHQPVRIHSGFNGKATAEVYAEFKEKFEESLVALQATAK